MGNNPSSSSKPATPTSTAPQSQSNSGPATPAAATAVGSGSSTHHHAHHHHHNHSSHQQHPSPTQQQHESQSPRSSRRDTRSIIHTAAQRSAAPPEESLAQANASRPKSLPGTAVSSLSGSPLSNISTPANSHKEAAAAAMTQKAAAGASSGASDPRPIIPSKPVDVPVEAGSHSANHPHAHYNSDTAARGAMADSVLISQGSLTDMYLTHPPRMPLPIEEEIHTPGSPILAPEEEAGLADIDELGDSADILTRKSSGLSAGTLDEDEGEELRVDKDRPTVLYKLQWKYGGDKVYVTGSPFQWNRKRRLPPV